MTINASKLIFFKEVFLKNDLTYLTLCLPLLMASFELTGLTIATFLLTILYLPVAWYFSFTQRTIFNSMYKLIILPVIVVFLSNHFVGISNLIFVGNYEMINGFVITAYTFISIYIAYSLFPHASSNYYADYIAHNREPETEYLKLLYRSMSYDNTIDYHYDDKVNLYVYGDYIHETGNKLIVPDKEKLKVGTLPDYFRYFKDLDIDYSTMNKDSLAVFKMYAI